MKNILVFRRGLIGDNLVATPALQCLRQEFPDAHLVLVSELDYRKGICWGEQVFGPSGLVDSVIPFTAYNRMSRLHQISATMNLYRTLHTAPWEVGVALDIYDFVRWEPMILRLLGARVILKPRSNGSNLNDSHSRFLATPHLADQLIEILQPMGLPLPGPGSGSMDVNLTPREVTEVDVWLNRIGAWDAPRPWIAIAPWTNMPAKQWPTDRFSEVVLRLKHIVGGTPFVFGSDQDQNATHNLIQSWGFGVPVAGSLNVRQGIALLKRCGLYLGNDCGAMHMAVSAGIRCVAIFSGRDKPGLWDPYGSGHHVLRKRIPCEGCMLRECKDHSGNCLKAIGIEEVMTASLTILKDHS